MPETPAGYEVRATLPVLRVREAALSETIHVLYRRLSELERTRQEIMEQIHERELAEGVNPTRNTLRRYLHPEDCSALQRFYVFAPDTGGTEEGQP